MRTPTESFTARREVILAGGAFNSPQLLQLSGIGPAALLQRHGIPLIADLPVGEGLQDHYYARTFWRCRKPLTLNDDMASWLGRARIGAQYLLRRQGPLTIAAGYAAAFARTRPALDLMGRNGIAATSTRENPLLVNS